MPRIAALVSASGVLDESVEHTGGSGVRALMGNVLSGQRGNRQVRPASAGINRDGTDSVVQGSLSGSEIR